MNAGIIASRYAKALLKLVDQTAGGDKVYRQVGVLYARMKELPQLRQMVALQEGVDNSQKLQLLVSAVGEPVADELDRLLRLVIAKDRSELLFLVLHSFLLQYRRSRGIIEGRLVTAAPAPHLEECLTALLSRTQGASAVVIDTTIDPQIIGGFIFTIGDELLDASVVHQLDEIRSQYIDKNRRII